MMCTNPDNHQTSCQYSLSCHCLWDRVRIAHVNPFISRYQTAAKNFRELPIQPWYLPVLDRTSLGCQGDLCLPALAAADSAASDPRVAEPATVRETDCLDISGSIPRRRVILTTTPTGPAPPDRVRGRCDYRALRACCDYRGHRDFRARRGSAHVPTPEIDLTDLVPN